MHGTIIFFELVLVFLVPSAYVNNILQMHLMGTGKLQCRANSVQVTGVDAFEASSRLQG